MTCRPLHSCIFFVSVTWALAALSGIRMGFLTVLQNSPSVAHPLSQPCGLGSTASICRLNYSAPTASPSPSLLSQSGISHPHSGKEKLFCEAVRQPGHSQTDLVPPLGALVCQRTLSQNTQGSSLVLISLLNKLGCKASSRRGVSPKRPHKPEDPPQPCTQPPHPALPQGSTAERGFSKGFESREKRRRTTWD